MEVAFGVEKHLLYMIYYFIGFQGITKRMENKLNQLPVAYATCKMNTCSIKDNASVTENKVYVLCVFILKIGYLLYESAKINSRVG